MRLAAKGYQLRRSPSGRAFGPFVGDESALKVHVHTDDPGAALSLGSARGVLEGIEIANMHHQTEQRETRLRLATAPQASELVAVVAGEGNERLFRSLGATQIVEGGQSMNPSRIAGTSPSVSHAWGALLASLMRT